MFIFHIIMLRTVSNIDIV